MSFFCGKQNASSRTVELEMSSVKLIFLFAVTLSLTNASLTFWDAFRYYASSSAFGVTLAVGAIFAAIGVLFGLIQHYLFQSLAVAQYGTNTELAVPLTRLKRCLAVLAAGAGIFMLLCLTAIISRFHEGYPLFG